MALGGGGGEVGCSDASVFKAEPGVPDGAVPVSEVSAVAVVKGVSIAILNTTAAIGRHPPNRI